MEDSGPLISELYGEDPPLAIWCDFLRKYAELQATDAAALLAQVTGVLKWELINSALSDEERAGYERGIPRRLRHLLELACA